MKATFSELRAEGGAPADALVPTTVDGSFFHRLVDGVYSLLRLERFFLVEDGAWIVPDPGADTLARVDGLHDRLIALRPRGTLQRSGALRVAPLRDPRGAATLLHHQRAAAVVFVRPSGSDLYASLYSYVRITPGIPIFVLVALIAFLPGELGSLLMSLLQFLPIDLPAPDGPLQRLVAGGTMLLAYLLVLGGLRLALARPELPDVDDARMLALAARSAVEDVLGERAIPADGTDAQARRGHRLQDSIGRRISRLPWIPAWRKIPGLRTSA